jgi:hypothetical protein
MSPQRFNLDHVREIVERSREAQGLPATIANDAALADIARLLRANAPAERADRARAS